MVKITHSRLISCALGALSLSAVASAGTPCGSLGPEVLKGIALELVEADLAGARLPLGSACLSELKPRYTRVSKDPVQEGGLSPESVGSLLKPRILAVTPSGPGEATASYKLGSGATALRDSLTFILHRDPKVQERHGCGGILTFPAKWRVRESCLPVTSRTLQKRQ